MIESQGQYPGEQRGQVYAIDLMQPRWHAVYTYPRHEKRVAAQLEDKSVEVYLPLYRSKRLWNQRRVEIDLPLFPGYVFARISQRERLRVLETPSVAYLVSSRGTPVALSDEEVEQVRQCLSRKLNVEPCEYLRPGTKVRVTGGPLQGLEGVVVRQNGRARFILSVDLIMRSIAISVEAHDLEAIEKASSVAA